MAGRIARRCRVPQRNAGFDHQQWRGAAMLKPPQVDKYEVLDPDEAQRLRQKMERRKEGIVDRYNRSLSEDRSSNVGSFRQRSDKYMRPFCLDVHLSSKYVNATIMHRSRGRVVAAVSTNSKDMRATLPSRSDLSACRIVGETLADRAKEADCYSVIYIPRKLERLEGKLAAVVEAVANCGISVYHADKGIMLARNSSQK
ncbi:uncharacterized protein LOC9643580 [Selaginella moellendorffii]|nr:uncharacterized protein LOC9643580 [Selaginella moellendorffii]|eukprot:XP_024521899.1 uncharacterized protein LOC9643580 [Selaginella moellendorffii]